MGAKTTRDYSLNRLEATSKFRERNKFNPLTQVCIEARAEEQMRAAQDAREMEAVMRAQSQIPPSYHGRISAAYDVVTHEHKDPEFVEAVNNLEQQRKSRYRTRHLTDRAIRERDL